MVSSVVGYGMSIDNGALRPFLTGKGICGEKRYKTNTRVIYYYHFVVIFKGAID